MGDTEQQPPVAKISLVGTQGRAKLVLPRPAPFLEVLLSDDAGEPVREEPFVVRTAQGEVLTEGTLDGRGFMRLNDLPGDLTSVELLFPEREEAWWSAASLPEPPPLSETAASETTAQGTPVAWLEIALLDEDGRPVAYEPFEVHQDGRLVAAGELDEAGCMRLANLSAGACEVVFPGREAAWWENVSLPKPLAVVEEEDALLVAA